jgi:phytol kinase
MNATPTLFIDRLANSPWLAIAVALSAFLTLFVIVQALGRAGGVSSEATRKILHAGSGLLTLTFPFLFREVWPVALLTIASAALLAATKFIPALRRTMGRAVSGVERTTLGEIYFPVAVVWLFWMTRGEHPLLFVIPILMLTLADATCALVGARYGLTKYEGASKSFEGSVAFAVVAFFCVHVPLLLWSPVGRLESLLIASTLALVVMLLEGSAWRGLDNLFIPIGGYFLLRVYLTLDADQLAARLIVTLVLVAVIVIARRSTTLEDDSLVAGAFLCYITWALMGWAWLVPPLVIFVGYKWLSPVTADNSRRMHGVPAVLSVWAPAIIWIVVARATADATLLLPFTLVFATHLAVFGVSRLAHQFPARPLAGLAARAIVVSWTIVLIPYLLTLGLYRPSVLAVLVAGPAVAIGSVVFERLQPDIRNTQQDARRWIIQAGAAALASVTGWAAWLGATRMFE